MVLARRLREESAIPIILLNRLCTTKPIESWVSSSALTTTVTKPFSPRELRPRVSNGAEANQRGGADGDKAKRRPRLPL